VYLYTPHSHVHVIIIIILWRFSVRVRGERLSSWRGLVTEECRARKYIKIYNISYYYAVYCAHRERHLVEGVLQGVRQQLSFVKRIFWPAKNKKRNSGRYMCYDESDIVNVLTF